MFMYVYVYMYVYINYVEAFDSQMHPKTCLLGKSSGVYCDYVW